jgi:predicted dehydrogenase
VSLKVVVVGAGNGASAHLRALGDIDAEVTAVVTGHPRRRAAALALFPRASVDWPATEALRRGADLAIVASPANTHLEIVREAAARGIDVVVEKPLAANGNDAEALVKTVQDKGTGLAVCFQHRAKPAGRALRALVRSGALGTFTGGAISVPWWRPAEYFAEPGRGTYARDGGGVLITQAIHTLDLLLWAAGRPRRVWARTGRVVQPLEAEDTIAGVLDYGDGRLVTLHATLAAYPGRDEELWLAGTEGTTVVHGGSLTHNGMTVVDDEAASTAVDPSAMPTAWHRALLQDAVEAFRTGREPLASGPSALVTQRVVAALYRSAAIGGWIEP